jgi:hypothetical protein
MAFFNHDRQTLELLLSRLEHNEGQHGLTEREEAQLWLLAYMQLSTRERDVLVCTLHQILQNYYRYHLLKVHSINFKQHTYLLNKIKNCSWYEKWALKRKLLSFLYGLGFIHRKTIFKWTFTSKEHLQRLRKIIGMYEDMLAGSTIAVKSRITYKEGLIKSKIIVKNDKEIVKEIPKSTDSPVWMFFKYVISHPNKWIKCDEKLAKKIKLPTRQNFNGTKMIRELTLSSEIKRLHFKTDQNKVFFTSTIYVNEAENAIYNEDDELTKIRKMIPNSVKIGSCYSTNMSFGNS